MGDESNVAVHALTPSVLIGDGQPGRRRARGLAVVRPAPFDITPAHSAPHGTALLCTGRGDGCRHRLRHARTPFAARRVATRSGAVHPDCAPVNLTNS